MNSFAWRIASNLGLDEAQVTDPMDQACPEIKDEAVYSKLNKLADEGLITGEQANEHLEWFKSRPNDLPGFVRGQGRHRDFKHGMKDFGPEGYAT